MAKQAKEKEPYSPTLDRIGQTKKREGRIVSWEAAPAATVLDLVIAVVDSGGAVLFGATPDRGAWAITFFHKGLATGKMTEYCNSEEMLENFLAGQVEIWRDVGAELKDYKG